MEKFFENIKNYKGLLILLILVSVPGITLISWLNGDQSRIVQEFIAQSNSQIAINIRNDDFGVLQNTPMYLPLLVSNIHEKDRAELLTRVFQKELLRDGVNMDLPSEYGIAYFFTDRVANLVFPLTAHSNNDRFGTITCEIGDNSILTLNRVLEEPYLIFVISNDTNVVEVKYENLEYNNIRLIGKEKGVTDIEIMLVSNEGTKFEKRKVKVK